MQLISVGLYYDTKITLESLRHCSFSLHYYVHSEVLTFIVKLSVGFSLLHSVRVNFPNKKNKN